MRAAADGAGLAFITDDVVTPLIKAGKLVCVMEDWCPPEPGLML
ncbi:hypothetical protein [Undibacterium sp.]